ncbi:MAG: DUF7146 domain-containing protein [Gammaproteobacteria bacterium]
MMTSLPKRLADRGIGVRHDREGTQRMPCPECDRGPRDTALAVTIEAAGGAVWLCHRCNFKGAIRGGRESFAGPPQAPPVKRSCSERYETLAPRWRDFWRECLPIRETSLAARYLKSCNCVLPPIDGDLRYHAEAWHWPTQQRMPAMIGLITDAVTCAPLSLHVTFLLADGSGKTGVERTKLLLPRHRKTGGVIQLWPDEAVTYSLGIAEGIESALSLAHAHSTVWCAVDAGNLASLPVLGGIETAVVAVDHDDAGQRAAHTFATRWTHAGIEVQLVLPLRDGADLNDVVAA